MNRADGSASPAVIAPRGVAPMLDVLGRRGRWVALAGGLALAAAFAPLGFAVLSIACPALQILLWQDTTPREAAWRGGIFTGATFLAGTYWLYHSVHEIGHAPLPVAIFLMLGLVAIMGGYSAGLGWLVARYAPRAGIARWMLLIPAGWILVEWVRGWLFSGFPWLSLGYAHLDTPLRRLRAGARRLWRRPCRRNFRRRARHPSPRDPRLAHRRRFVDRDDMGRGRVADTRRVDRAA